MQLTTENRSDHNSVAAVPLLLLLTQQFEDVAGQKKNNKPFSYTHNSHSFLKQCGHVTAKLLFGKLDSLIPSLLRKTDDVSLFSGFEINWEKTKVLLLSRFCPRISVLILQFVVVCFVLAECCEALRYLGFSITH